ncbi:sensor domain-containing diguanylate cyclase [Microvirga thermotolerans]|uniref:diguanylate cyclase n=1 Tax=Microvirga thermotolerans TaxID=2651334 RepID=A0A5P9JYM5_9HYPH|nr:sensor domain-containing diguanylate cyclase [Microvirga thermotolerans]QFU16510.1 diguanylate cyclase [Microvirga thermotolerans]
MPIDHSQEAGPARRFRPSQLPRPASIRLLQTFIILVCAAILGLEGWRDLTEHEKALEDAEVQMANLARSLRQHAEDTFEMTDYALAAVIDLLQANGTSREAMENLHSVLVNRVSLLPRIREIAVYGPDGSWLASSSQEILPDKSNQGDKGFFVHHRNSLSRRPYFAPPDRSRPLGERITTISRRFSKPDGSFGGVVVAVLDPSYFVRFYSQFDIGKHGSITLLSKDGTLLARVPYLETYPGVEPSRASPIVERLSRSPSGSFRLHSPIDGVSRVLGYDSGSYFPFFVVAGVSRSEALADWRREILVRGTGIGILVGAIGILGWRLVVQSRRRERAEAKLAILARTDGLTGLANRRSFDEQLAKEWYRSVRDRAPLSLVLVDIDRFKQFNDTYGHQAGDDCLRAVARAVRQVARRPADLPARYGGEEIVLLLPATGPEGAAKIAERLRSSVEAMAIPHAGNQPKGVVTVSVGTATLHLKPETAGERCDTLISLADSALYDAKRQGRNRVVMAAPGAIPA